MTISNCSDRPPWPDPRVITRVLALGANSSELIAALYETFVGETFVGETFTPEAFDAERLVAREAGSTSDGVRLLTHDSFDPSPDPSPDPYALTLRERARRIDPVTGGCLVAVWGEELPVDTNDDDCSQRIVNEALCWYSFVTRDDLVPDWAMRDAWPELEPRWQALRETAWERHSSDASNRRSAR